MKIKLTFCFQNRDKNTINQSLKHTDKFCINQSKYIVLVTCWVSANLPWRLSMIGLDTNSFVWINRVYWPGHAAIKRKTNKIPHFQRNNSKSNIKIADRATIDTLKHNDITDHFPGWYRHFSKTWRG